jgi:hypothetical protein
MRKSIFFISKIDTFCYENSLRTNQVDEDHQTDDLPERPGGLGETEEVNDDIVPEEFADERNNHKGHDESQENSNRVGIHLTLHVRGGISKTFDGCAASRFNSRHSTVSIEKKDEGGPKPQNKKN